MEHDAAVCDDQIKNHNVVQEVLDGKNETQLAVLELEDDFNQVKDHGIVQEDLDGKNDPQRLSVSQDGFIPRNEFPKSSRLLKCSFCVKKFPTRKSLKQHVVTVHLWQEPHECSLCHKEFKLKSSLIRHSKQSCLVGKRDYSNILHNTELEKVKDCVDDRFVVTVTADGQRNIKSYALLSELKKQSYACSVCDKTFNSTKALYGHMKKHGGKVLYRCLNCRKSFKQEGYLWQHMKTHKDGSLHKCFKCGKGFSTVENCKKHFFESHPRHKCLVCAKLFKFKKSLDAHMRDGHTDHCLGNSNSKLIDEVVDHIHSDASKTENDRNVKKTSGSYIKVKAKSKYTCKICLKVFALQSSVSRHMKIHEGVKFKCDFCRNVFSRKDVLLYHMQSVHKLNADDQNEGNGLLTEQNNESVHLISKDPRDTLHKCPTCGLKFIHRHELNTHIKIHTGEKPYKCLLCGQTFNGRTHIQDHMSSCH